MTADIFPEDSVLRRHAMTERMRILGLPPTDSVLRRHYAQLQQTDSAGHAPVQAQVRPQAAAAPRAASVASTAPKTAAAPAREAAPARDAQPAQSGGFFGWLKRLIAG